MKQSLLELLQRQKPYQIILVGIAGTLLSIFGFSYSTSLEQQQLNNHMSEIIQTQRSLLQKKIVSTNELLFTIGNIISNGEIGVNREVFQLLTEPVLKRHPEIFAIHWLPYTPHSERSNFEKEIASEGFTQGITQLLPNLNSIQYSTPKQGYYPVLYTEPLKPNRNIIGFDTQSRATNQQAMQLAKAHTDSSAFTKPFKLIQDQEGSSATVIFHAIDQPDAEPSNYIAAIIKPQALLNSLAEKSPSIAFTLMDKTEGESQEIASINFEKVQPNWYTQSVKFKSLSRDWQLALFIDPNYYQIQPLFNFNNPTWFLFGGLCFTWSMLFMLSNLKFAHQKALNERDKAQSYLDAVETIMLALDREGNIKMINRRGCEALGYTEKELLGENWFNKKYLLHAAADQQKFNSLMQSIPCTTTKQLTENTIRDHSGQIRLISWHNVIQLNQDNQPVSMLSAGNDITLERRLQQLEKIRSQAMQASLQSRPLSEVLSLVLKGIEDQKPDALCSILLLDESGKHLHMGAAPSLPEEYNQKVDGITIGPAIGSCGTAAFRKERVIVEDIQTHPYWKDFKELAAEYNLQSCWSEPIFGKNRRVLGTFAIYHNHVSAPSNEDLELISDNANFLSLLIEEHQTEALLIRMAHTDELTSLANRRKFLDSLSNEYHRAERLKAPLTLLMLDLDHFKAINDRYGHAAGDQVLKEVAKTIQKLVRQVDLAARIGGEEFAVLLPDTDRTNASSAAERIREAISHLQIRIKSGESLSITLSIGVSIFTEGSNEIKKPTDLLSVADHCLYFAKENGRNQVSFTHTFNHQ